MCGISGIIQSHQSSINGSQLIKNIINDQFKRGPDNQAMITVSNNYSEVILGHNRLAIIDLSDQSNQPMWDRTKRYCIVYNGMIYNYKDLKKELIELGIAFETSSDTEVLLYAFSTWGIECINKLNGMFSFAIYDNMQKELYLVRDRFGVKPLYYYKSDRLLAFASTSNVISGFFSCHPNKNYLAKGLNFGIYEDGTDETAYENLYSVPPGSFLRYDCDNFSITVTRYYDLSERVKQKQREFSSVSNADLISLIENSLNRAINIRLCSDVPLGLSVSGGLDSSLVAGITGQNLSLTGFHYGSPINTKTEGPLVHKISQYCNIPIHYSQNKEFINSYFETLKAQDAPFAGLSIIAQNIVFKDAHEKGIKVLLGGQGGDEVFMGYRKFFYFYYQELFRQKKIMNLFFYLTSLIPTIVSELPRYKQYLYAKKHYSGKQTSILSTDNLNYSPNLQTDQGITQRQCADILQYSLPTLLRYEDRNSMFHSIETRLPFIDYELVEMGLALPIDLKIKHGYGKWVLRKIAKNKIPDIIRTARYKRGFDVINEEWIGQGLGQKIRNQIGSNIDVVCDYIQLNINLEKDYCDKVLIENRQKLKEIITLSWLAEKLR